MIPPDHAANHYNITTEFAGVICPTFCDDGGKYGGLFVAFVGVLEKLDASGQPFLRAWLDDRADSPCRPRPSRLLRLKHTRILTARRQPLFDKNSEQRQYRQADFV